MLSCVQLLATPWTVACQALLSKGFSRQEYWSGLPFTSPGDLPHPGIKPGSPALQAISLQLNHQGSCIYIYIYSWRRAWQHTPVCLPGESPQTEEPGERVTGRKARGLQTEEIACKCQTFLSLLSGRRKQTSYIFSFSIQI